MEKNKYETKPLYSAKVEITDQSRAIAYDRKIFGGFLEHFHREVYGGIFDPGSSLSDEMGFREDVIEAFKDLGTPIVRWPGGCFASAYHWQHGVGSERQPNYDKAWCVEDPNTFGTDEFIAWCRKVGTEPYICTNAGTGTMEEMSNWVEYCNLEKAGMYARQRITNGHAEPYGVKYWHIGNENLMGHEMGTKTPEEWGRFVVEAAKMIKRVDGNVKLVSPFAPTIHDKEKIVSLLKTIGTHVDYVACGSYWYPRNDTTNEYERCLIFDPDGEIPLGKSLISEAGLKGKVKIVYYEWNYREWYHPVPWNTPENIKARDRNDDNSWYTMADAVFSAGVLNSFLRNAEDVEIAFYSPSVNSRGLIYTHPKGLVKRSTDYVLHMYAHNLLPLAVEGKVSSDRVRVGEKDGAVIDAAVTCTRDRREYAIVIINRHPAEAASVSVSINNRVLDGEYQAIELAGDAPDAFNDTGNPDRVKPVSKKVFFSDGTGILPPHSVSIISMKIQL